MKFLVSSLVILVVTVCLFKSSEGARGRRVLLGRSEYKFSNGDKKNWHGAKDECRSDGMRLISIETARENSLIKDYLENEAASGDYWTSGTDAGRSKNDFVWDSADGKRVIFQDFHHGEPNSQNYIALTFKNGQYKWSDESAYNQYMYICEEQKD